MLHLHSGQRFRQEVCNVVFGGAVSEVDFPGVETVANIMKSDVNMFCASGKFRIFYHADRGLIVRMDSNWFWNIYMEIEQDVS